MGEMDEKEVYYYQFCGKCAHRNKDESKEPCVECLAEPSRVGTHKPLKWEARG